MLFGAGAIEECVTAGSTAAAVVGEVTGTSLTPGGFVEIEANEGRPARLFAGFLVGAVIRLMVQARAYRTMELSSTRKGHRPKFNIYPIP